MKDKLGTEKEITSKNSSTVSFSYCKEGVSNFNVFGPATEMLSTDNTKQNNTEEKQTDPFSRTSLEHLSYGMPWFQETKFL